MHMCAARLIFIAIIVIATPFSISTAATPVAVKVGAYVGNWTSTTSYIAGDLCNIL